MERTVFRALDQGKTVCLGIALILMAQTSILIGNAEGSRSAMAPSVEPYIDAMDCIETNGTFPCNSNDTINWPHNATIYRRDSQTGVTEATLKMRIEGKGDPTSNPIPQQTVIVMDDSGSMAWNDPNNLRFDASKVYVDKLNSPDEIGFVIYADPLPSGAQAEIRSPLTTNYQSAKTGMYGNSNGGTPMISGFMFANDELIPKKKANYTWVLIHVTDGCWNTGGDPQPQVDRMVNEQVIIYNIGLYPDPNSSDKSMCEPSLIKWAQQTGGNYYWAQSAGDISKLMTQVYQDVSHSISNSTAGTPPKTGAPMITFQLTNDIEVVPNSFGGSMNYKPTSPAAIIPNNRGLRLEWAAPVKILKIKQVWDVFFKVRSYIDGQGIKVNDVSRSYVEYDRYDGSPGGADKFEQLFLEVIPPSPSQFPSIVSTIPSEGATNVAKNQRITMTWSKEMDKTSAEGAFSSIPMIQCAWSWSGVVQACTPFSDMQANTSFLITMSTSAKDTTGNAMLKTFILKFTTGSNIIKHPIVTDVYPMNDSKDVPVTTKIATTFSEAMDHSATESAIQVSPIITGDFTWDIASKIIVLTPSTALVTSTNYAVTIAISARSQAGMELKVPYSFSFTTASGTGPSPPVVIGTDPQNRAIDIRPDAKISILFSKAMNKTSTIGAISPNPVISWTPAWSSGDSVVTLAPNPSLHVRTTYIITITPAAKSTDDIHLASPFTFSFTTDSLIDTIPPTVVITNPENDSTDINTTTSISITFSEPMDRAPTENAVMIVPGSIIDRNWSQDDTVLTLTVSLEEGKRYTVIVHEEVKDLVGNQMITPYLFSFTTKGSSVPPVISISDMAILIVAAVIAVVVVLLLLFLILKKKRHESKRKH